MCPFCVASLAWAVGSVVSTGGVGAVAVQIFRAKKREKKDPVQNRKDESNGKGEMK
jgi:hypothetical protein